MISRVSMMVVGVALCTLMLSGCGDEAVSPSSPIDGEANPSSESIEHQLDLPDGSSPESHLPDHWRQAVYREICYAISRQRYHHGDWGASNRIINGWFDGDWSYRGLGRGIGGQCKSFAREIVRRATGNRYDLPTGYNYAQGNIAWCKPGDVIQRSNSYGTPHTAIVFKILERDSQGRATKIDVIDSNFIRSRTIGRHVLPRGSYRLHQFKVW